MKKNIDGTVYDTETAELILVRVEKYQIATSMNCTETLYRAKNGTYFIHVNGGPLSKWSVKPSEYEPWQGREDIVLTKIPLRIINGAVVE